MKKVEAIVQPFKLPEVKEALAAIGVTILTISEVQESERHGRHTETYRGQEYTVDSPRESESTSWCRMVGCTT